MAIIDVRKFDASEHVAGTISQQGLCSAGGCRGKAAYTVEGSTEKRPKFVWAVCEEHRPELTVDR